MDFPLSNKVFSNFLCFLNWFLIQVNKYLKLIRYWEMHNKNFSFAFSKQHERFSAGNGLKEIAYAFSIQSTYLFFQISPSPL